MKKMSALFFLIFLLIFAACSDKEASKEVEEPKDEPTDTEVETEVEPEEIEYKNVFPLTGIKTNEPVNNRIVGVMINNHSSARPQSGLSQADIVYEILAEGPITRFIAFYHSETPEVVGPVRSAREYYGKLANELNAIYVYHGAAAHVEQKILSTGVDVLQGMIYDNDQFLFKRESFRVAPHNSYLIYPNVYEVASQNGIAVEGDYEPYPFLEEEEVEALSGSPATEVEVIYFENQEEVLYEYDEVNEKYVRYSDGEKTVEYETEEPILLDNIFIVETAHAIIDDEGRRSVDLDSGGKGYLIRKGTVEEVTWENVDGRILPFQDGQPMKFVPGKTWINVVPTSPGIEQSVTIQ